MNNQPPSTRTPLPSDLTTANGGGDKLEPTKPSGAEALFKCLC